MSYTGQHPWHSVFGRIDWTDACGRALAVASRRVVEQVHVGFSHAADHPVQVDPEPCEGHHTASGSIFPRHLGELLGIIGRGVLVFAVVGGVCPDLRSRGLGPLRSRLRAAPRSRLRAGLRGSWPPDLNPGRPPLPWSSQRPRPRPRPRPEPTRARPMRRPRPELRRRSGARLRLSRCDGCRRQLYEPGVGLGGRGRVW